MKGLKHLIECHCVLPQFRKRENPPYHKFVVFSLIDDSDTAIPKHARCNNCGVIHNVIDICKSEILPGQEVGAVMTKKDCGMMLPSGNDSAYALAEFFGRVLKEKKYTQSYEDEQRASGI